MLFVGVDHARDGAVVVLNSSGQLRSVVSWRKGKRNKADRFIVSALVGGQRIDRVLPYRAGALGVMCAEIVTLTAQQHGMVIDTHGNVEPGLRTMPHLRVACEDVYVGRNARTSVKVARFAGGVVCPLEELAGREARWVQASEWRAAIVGTGKMKRADLKAAALRYIPLRVGGLLGALSKLGDRDHIAEAAGIAEWCRVTNPRT